MKRSPLMDLYTDFLTSSPNVASALLFSQVLNQAYSHDSITRMLAQEGLDQKQYWQVIKKTVRQVESADGVISVDDFIEHKPHSSENELISWHYDHSSGRSVKGINIVSFTYVSDYQEQKIKLPLAFELVRKDQQVTRTVKEKGRFVEKTTRKATVGKNELLRTRLKVLTHQNYIKYAYIAFDTWYSSVENMHFIVKDLKKHFVCAIKDNRKVSFEPNKPTKDTQFVAVSAADIEPDIAYDVYLKDVDIPLKLVKKVYQNLDGSIGVQYLLSSDTTLTASQISGLYKKRWASEDVHRSLKQNVALEKMPAKMEASQANHIFAAFSAQLKLECMKIATNKNHYTLKRNILMQALKVAWQQIQKLKELCLNKNINLPNFTAA